MKNKFVCLSKGTKVLLKNALTKNIEDIKIDDEICNFNINNKIIEFSKVKKIVRSFHTLATIIHFSNEKDLICTLDHPILIEGKGWCSSDPESSFENYNLPVSQIMIGDKCLNMDSGEFSIVSINEIIHTKIEEQMYVISGGKNNNFFANGFIVSDENILNVNFNIFQNKLIEEEV